jgi:hypothetical protein
MLERYETISVEISPYLLLYQLCALETSLNHLVFPNAYPKGRRI